MPAHAISTGRSPSSFIASNTALQMSSIPDDKDSISGGKKNGSFKFRLPPAPEDPIAMSGDILALFTYTYLDHTMNFLFAETAAKTDVVGDYLVPYDASTAPSLPVWFDPSHLQTFGNNWLANNHMEIPYAPALSTSGLAFVAISISWLICGCFSGAFLNKNTLECDTPSAMIVTLKTWVGTACLMVILALWSDCLWGQLDEVNALSDQARGGLTTADMDYIFDSLTVLTFWRGMFNWLLGYKR